MHRLLVTLVILVLVSIAVGPAAAGGLTLSQAIAAKEPMRKTWRKLASSRALLLAMGLGLALTLSAGLMRGALAQHGDKAPPITIPDTPAAIWQLIDKEAADTATAIHTGALKDLHHHAYAIRDLVAALAAHPGSLPADKAAKVKTDAKFVATLAQRLDAAGDSNNKAPSKTSFDRLTEVLKTIRANYVELLTQ